MNMLGNWEDFLPNETIELAKKLYKKAEKERRIFHGYFKKAS